MKLALVATAVALLFAPLTASASVTAADGPPPVGGAILNGLDLARLGYQASEFYLDGDAHSYQNVAGAPFTNDGIWVLEADAATAPFKTRLQVLKPINPRRFNGTVYVEWMLNVPTTGNAPNTETPAPVMVAWVLFILDLTAQPVPF